MSAPATPAAADPIVELCAFAVGDDEYVLDLRRIREIVQPLPIVPVPHGPAWMEGVVDLRGEVVPVVDLRSRLGLARRPPTRRSKLLVTHVGGHAVALAVDGVSGVVRTPRSHVGPPPAMAGTAGPRLFLGVCGARAPAATRPDGGRAGAPQRLRLLLNVKALVASAGEG